MSSEKLKKALEEWELFTHVLLKLKPETATVGKQSFAGL